MVLGPGLDLREWIQSLVDSGVIPPNPRRIVIDIAADLVAKVYYECEADKRMFTVSLGEMLKGADVIGVADMPEKPSDS